jgi:hypothetical protein
MPGVQELGIPTANLDSASLHGQLAEAVTGIYAGKVPRRASHLPPPALCHISVL